MLQFEIELVKVDLYTYIWRGDVHKKEVLTIILPQILINYKSHLVEEKPSYIIIIIKLTFDTKYTCKKMWSKFTIDQSSLQISNKTVLY